MARLLSPEQGRAGQPQSACRRRFCWRRTSVTPPASDAGWSYIFILAPSIVLSTALLRESTSLVDASFRHCCARRAHAHVLSHRCHDTRGQQGQRERGCRGRGQHGDALGECLPTHVLRICGQTGYAPARTKTVGKQLSAAATNAACRAVLRDQPNPGAETVCPRPDQESGRAAQDQEPRRPVRCSQRFRA